MTRTVLVVLGAVVAVAMAYLSSILVGAYRVVPSIVEEAQRLDRTSVRIEDLPAEWKQIILRVEDPGFYDHHGVDVSTPGAGLTTITQGLVKIHFFRRFAPGLHAKLKQSLCAIVLDRALAKDLQLTLLLHTARFGSSGAGAVVGFPAAARTYFGRDLQGLSRAEFVSLVAMLIGPAAYHPTHEAEALGDRVARIEALLAGRCQPSGPRDVFYESCAR